jgi:hypothetical protein
MAILAVIALSQPTSQMSGVSQSHVGDKLIEIVQYYQDCFANAIATQNDVIHTAHFRKCQHLPEYNKTFGAQL